MQRKWIVALGIATVAAVAGTVAVADSSPPYLKHARYNPNHAGFGELTHVAGARWPIEECFGSAKNEVGLDNYQVRTWDAWHRHITLAMLAHTFLAVTAHKTKKGGANKPNS